MPVTSSVFATERLLFTPVTPNTDAIPTIFAFPNDYTVGITSLGYQVVWATLAMRSDMQVSRLFTDTHEQLPRESEDLEQTVAMMRSLKKTVPGLRLTFGCSTFVPKAHTPFQWFGVNRQAEKQLQLLQKQLKPQGIDFRPESYNW